MGRIDRAGISCSKLYLFPQVRSREVRIQRQHAAEFYRLRAALPAFQHARNESADIFDVVLLGLRHPQVFGLRFLCHRWRIPEAGQEILPGYLPVLPVLIKSAFAD